MNYRVICHFNGAILAGFKASDIRATDFWTNPQLGHGPSPHENCKRKRRCNWNKVSKIRSRNGRIDSCHDD
jgi:hypothetical protein